MDSGRQGRERRTPMDNCRTRQEGAPKELAKLLNGGNRAKDRKASVGDRTVQWLETEAKARLKASTFAEYRRAFLKHINPRLG
jgi:hypothetical protein